MPTFYLQFALHFAVDQRSSPAVATIEDRLVPWLFLASILVVLLSWSMRHRQRLQPAAQLPEFFLFQAFWLDQSALHSAAGGAGTLGACGAAGGNIRAINAAPSQLSV